MTNFNLRQRQGEFIHAVIGTAAIPTFTAGSGGDNVTVNSPAIDRTALKYLTEVFTVPYSAVLGAGESLTISYQYQDSADNVTFADLVGGDYDGTSGSVVIPAPALGGAVSGVAVLSAKVSASDKWVRIQITPDLSAAGVDTASLGIATRLLYGQNQGL